VGVTLTHARTCSGSSKGLKKFVIGNGVIAVLRLHNADSLYE
jgi:hypothetical protein